MSKFEELYKVVSNLRALADSIQAAAEALANGETAQTPETEAKEKPEEQPPALEEVRAVLAEKSHGGFTAEVRGLLEKHGAAKLSEIDPVNYAALLKDAEGLK